jgi:hypothetical protein
MQSPDSCRNSSLGGSPDGLNESPEDDGSQHSPQELKYSIGERLHHECPRVGCNGRLMVMVNVQSHYIQCSTWNKDCRGWVRTAIYPGCCLCGRAITEGNLITRHQTNQGKWVHLPCVNCHTAQENGPICTWCNKPIEEGETTKRINIGGNYGVAHAVCSTVYPGGTSSLYVVPLELFPPDDRLVAVGAPGGRGTSDMQSLRSSSMHVSSNSFGSSSSSSSSSSSGSATRDPRLQQRETRGGTKRTIAETGEDEE